MMRRRQFDPTLKDCVYVFLMREAVRKAGVLRNLEPSTTVLWLHPELSIDHASMVLERVILDDERFNIAKVEQSTRRIIDYSKAKTLLLDKKSLVVVLQSVEQKLPSFLVAAADAVIKVGMIAPRHLCGALRAGNGIAATTRQAEALLLFPSEEMFAALRPGRSAEVALSKLAAAVEAPAKPMPPEVSVLGLEDLSGYGDAKIWGLELAKDIADWRSGRITWGDIDTGMLLSGPPGTGKTLYAAALARTCNAHFLPRSLAQWQAKGHLGDLLKAMRADFATAAEQAPCVMLLDEFDSIGDRSKFATHHSQYSTEVVNALLECIDGSSRLEGVVIIGACNDPSKIDPALLRSGRLGSQFAIGLPDSNERQGMLKTLVGDALRKTELQEIAEATQGFVAADIARLARTARRSSRLRRKPLSLKDFQSVIVPAIPIEGFHRRLISAHEAGHAIVGNVLKIGFLDSITVASSYRQGASTPSGSTNFVRQPQGFMSRQSFLDEIAMMLGGLAAEDMLFGSFTSGSGGGQGSDLQRAADLATRMQVQFGMGDALGHLHADTPEQLDVLRRSNAVIFTRVETMLGRQMERARAILDANRAALEAIAKEACVEGTVSGVTVDRLLTSNRDHGRLRSE